MYDKLFDNVSQIVKTYGVAIIDDPKFWHILKDSYSISSNISLRNEFKKCIDNGWVTALISFKRNKRLTVAFIKQTVDSEKQCNKDELIISLFAIAIGLGASEKSDYLEFIGKSNNTNQQPPNSKSKWNNPFSWKEWCLLCWFVTGGAFLSIGGTIFYSAFYHGWWLFFIVLFSGIAQLFYCGLLSETLSETQNKSLRNSLLSATLPFLLAIIGNIILSFLFFFQSFRNWLANHLHDYSSDEPTFITFILCLVSLFFTGIFSSICIGGNDFNIDLYKLKEVVNNKIFKWTVSILIIAYLILFFLPKIDMAIMEYRIHEAESDAINEYHRKIEQNDKLVKMRDENKSELSFKNVRLGIDFDTDIQYANSNVDFCDGHEGQYNFTISKDTHPINLLLNENPNGYSLNIDNDSINKNVLRGKVYSGNTSIDNIPVELKIYEKDGLVPLIIIESAGFRGFSSESFSQLKSLYTKKYGEPEMRNPEGNPNMPSKSEYHYSYYTSAQKNEDFVWTFPKGIIRLNCNKIIYATPDFLDIIIRKYEIAKQEFYEREKFIADSIRKQEEFLMQERLRELRKDSVRRLRNHKNAINEI